MTDDTRDSDATAALRATSDALMAALEELRGLELRKRDLPPDDPRFRDLARQVDDVAQALLQQSERQARLADGAARGTITITTAIVDVPADLAIPVILERWRDAERRLSDAEPGSRAAGEAEAESDAYREAYRRALDERQ